MFKRSKLDSNFTVSGPSWFQQQLTMGLIAMQSMPQALLNQMKCNQV